MEWLRSWVALRPLRLRFCVGTQNHESAVRGFGAFFANRIGLNQPFAAMPEVVLARSKAI